MVSFSVKKKILVWFFLHIESFLTKGIIKFHKLAFRVADGDKFIEVRASGPKPLVSVGNNVGVIITTFEPRFEHYALPLISSIRKSISNPIYLVVNANYDGPASAPASKKLIEGIAEFENVFPIFFGQMQGCASLWNTGIKHSNSQANFILNDDISINHNTIAEEMQLAVDQMDDAGLVTINKSWSHYLISSRCLEKIGNFDERFLGFGYEDTDYINRVKEKMGEEPANIWLSGFINLVDQSREEKVTHEWGKYSLFNACLFRLKYPKSDLVYSFPPIESADVIPKDYDTATINNFRGEFFPLLLSENSEEIMESILRFYSEEI